MTRSEKNPLRSKHLAAALGGVLALTLVTLAPAPAVAGVTCDAAGFGAVPDDGVDDTAALQSALDSACGIVALGSGRYLLSDTLRVPGGGGLSGAATLHQTADVDTILNADPAGGDADITLEGFVLDKDFVNNSIADGIRLENVDGLRIEGIEITGISARSGIELLDSRDFTVTDNYLHGYSADDPGTLPDGDPISIDAIYIRMSDGGLVAHNRIEDLDGGPRLQSDGIFLTGDDVIVEHNVISNVGEAIDLGAAENNIIRFNRATDISGWGLKMGNGSRNNEITANYVLRAQLAGIVVFNGASSIAGNGPTENNSVTFNTVVNAGSQDRTTHPFPEIPRAGISLHGYLSEWAPVTNTRVEHNVIIDTYLPHRMEYGIWEDLNNVGNTMKSNVIVGALKANFRDDTTPWCDATGCGEY